MDFVKINTIPGETKIHLNTYKIFWPEIFLIKKNEMTNKNITQHFCITLLLEQIKINICHFM